MEDESDTPVEWLFALIQRDRKLPIEVDDIQSYDFKVFVMSQEPVMSLCCVMKGPEVIKSWLTTRENGMERQFRIDRHDARGVIELMKTPPPEFVLTDEHAKRLEESLGIPDLRRFMATM